jgi:hypothetical protein
MCMPGGSVGWKQFVVMKKSGGTYASVGTAVCNFANKKLFLGTRST